MSKKEKLSKPKGLRLTPTVAKRLATHSAERGEEEIDIIRRALITELDRLDSMIPDATHIRLNKLREAGLDFSQVVDDAIARKVIEDAQLKIPQILDARRDREAVSA